MFPEEIKPYISRDPQKVTHRPKETTSTCYSGPHNYWADFGVIHLPSDLLIL